MRIKPLFLVASTLAALLPFSAQAERMNYAFIEIGPQLTDLNDTVDTKGEGFSLRGSWIYGPYVFTDFRYEDAGLDGNVDITTANLRVGARTAIDNIRTPMRLDAYGMLSYEDVEITRGGTEFLDDGGLGVALGLRFGPIKELEFGLEVNYHDIGDSGAVFGVAEGIWNVSDWFAFVGTYRNGSYSLPGNNDIDRQDATVGFRIQFGGDEEHSLRNPGGTWSGGKPGTLE